ncbi:MAG TPA: glycosyltransferase family 39 protein [Solirubrobacteraceae bacterium]|nr:glycosyltransferase family 39 protein [Solirubrobacteraceae bacterium]
MSSAERPILEDRPGPRWLASRWLVPVALALPFVVMVAALKGLTVTLPIFHSTDEGNYIYPTIVQFAHQLPFPDLGHYVAAQTPLFPLLEAYVGKLIGYALWEMRLVEVVLSYLLALAVYVLLERRLGLRRLQALALSVLFVLSPYVFGTSFRAITDNLATLFIVLAIERFERFRETERTGPFLVGCCALAGATLTRQSAAFMLGVAGLYALWVGLPLLRRGGLLVAVAISAVPVGLLFLSWHGLVPPGGDPSSCALCAPGRDAGATQGGLVVQTPELALATFGLYGAVLFAPTLLEAAWAGRGRSYRDVVLALRAPAIGLVLGALLLLAFPARPGVHSAGVLWNAAKRLPIPLGSSLLFWVLVPLSGAILGWRWRVGPRRWLLFAFFASFLVGALAIRYPWQKYVDPFALLALFFTVRRDELVSLRELAGVGVLALAFIAYAASFVT